MLAGDPGREVALSGVCGATTGGLYSLLFRGSRGLLGAVLLYGSLGGVGESVRLAIRRLSMAAPSGTTAPRSKPVPEGEKGVWQRLTESSPLRSIPNDEFEQIMVDKIKSLDEQITLVDAEIQSARKVTGKVETR